MLKAHDIKFDDASYEIVGAIGDAERYHKSLRLVYGRILAEL